MQVIFFPFVACKEMNRNRMIVIVVNELTIVEKGRVIEEEQVGKKQLGRFKIKQKQL